MASYGREPAPPLEIRISGSQDQPSVLSAWLAVERKLAPGWSPQRDGDIRAVLDAWRAAERSLTMNPDAEATVETPDARVADLRAEYHRLFKAAIGAPPRVPPARDT